MRAGRIGGEWWGLKSGDSHVESPGALRSKDVFHRPDLWIECTERYTDPGTDCDDSEGPNAEVSLRAAALEARGTDGPTSPNARCAIWNGPSVVATVCDPFALRRAMRDGRVGEDGGLSVAGAGARGRSFASGRGIAQLVGQPLSMRETLIVRGKLSRRAQIGIRVRGPRGGWTVVFRGDALGAGPRRVIGFGRAGEVASAYLLESDHDIHSPSQISRTRGERP
jgi:hypothetical protein